MKTGRPINPEGITKNGMRFCFWISKQESSILDEKSKELDTTKAQLIRKLIREMEK